MFRVGAWGRAVGPGGAGRATAGWPAYGIQSLRGTRSARSAKTRGEAADEPGRWVNVAWVDSSTPDASPRQRALEAFASLRVWDTRANNGVLLYLLLADRAIEIVADRGLHEVVADSEWQSICAAVEAGIHDGDIEAAVIEGVQRICVLLARHFPASEHGRDELPNRPRLL